MNNKLIVTCNNCLFKELDTSDGPCKYCYRNSVNRKIKDYWVANTSKIFQNRGGIIEK